ncbi:aryl-sulfate sulfotransferase [Ferrimonas lipolytica]|uniref:Aryl-sulfate sulfotransferase n=2 Tax=Ferrimonas lipolytica TaxID=2724191 RepID=A0A6H1UKT4_9GAMM|nr:aryl-sulfate sulfotransferase [Ferrimonas lipolytica]
MFKKTVLATVVAGLAMASINAHSAGLYGMKPKVGPNAPLGYIVHDPYGNAPLTALVTLNNHKISDVTVTVHADDKDGVPITYDVGDMRLYSEGGVPIFGLYPDFNNTFTVSYSEGGEKKSAEYRFYAPDVDVGINQNQWAKAPTAEVHHVDPEFKDRLYFVNFTTATTKEAKLTHNNVTAQGAFNWDGTPAFLIYDTAGDIRWFMNPHTTHDPSHFEKAGYAMGMNVTAEGNMAWVQGQGWKEMTLMGRMISEHSLPGDFIDASHEGMPIENGNYLLRVAKKDYKRRDGKIVNTIRDHIIEVDARGELVDFWDLNEILDPMRDAALLSLDAGAVCLNIDVDKAGHQATAEDIHEAPYGDIHGVETGRNWVHVNSVDYDPEDDSIILSSRHQSAVFKITRDKKVKWILGAPRGWKGELADKVLTPVDKRGKKLNCDDARCYDTDFDYSWTSHTAYKVDEKGTLTVFDNGDGRYLEQPTFPTDKYSRAVEYKIDEDKMTVQQVWEYGKDELGYEGYSPVTSIVKYQADKDSVMTHFASAGLFGVGGGYGNLKMDETTGKVKSIITEHRYGETKPAVRIDIDSHRLFATGYRAQVIRPSEMMQ